MRRIGWRGRDRDDGYGNGGYGDDGFEYDDGDGSGDDRDGGAGRRRAAVPVASLVAALGAAVLFGPSIVDGFSGGDGSGASPPPPAVSEVSGDAPVDASADPSPGAPAPRPVITLAPEPPASTEPASTEPPSTDPGSTDPSGTAVAAATDPITVPIRVDTLQLVPAIRDVIVEVGGVRRSSDAFGRIDVSSASPDDVVELIGIEVTPAISRATFVSWADGETTAARPLSELTGPTAGLAIVVSNRVVVSLASEAGSGAVADARVTFSSEAGSVELATGVLQWVPFARGVLSDQGLLAQQLTYSSTAVTAAGVTTPVTRQQFVASPEASWRIGD